MDENVSHISILGKILWYMNERARSALAIGAAWMAACFLVGSTATGGEMGNVPLIDAEFPGGNIVVERIDGDDVYLHQDPRDTAGFWFYWYFRVRNASGRTLTFRFTKGDVVGVRGPAVSRDSGKTWTWFEDDSVTPRSFTYTFADDDEVRFCLAMPYLQADLERFLSRHAGSAHLQVERHCISRKGREVKRLHLGCVESDPVHRVLLTCRHHSCEMMASWVLEGAIDHILSETDDGRWLRKNVEFLAIPIVDVDGVEDGDQGKNRTPHDHNRDYLGQPIYPEVAALKECVPQWSGGKLRLAIDLHCPYIRGGDNQEIFFVGGPDEQLAENLDAFSRLLEQTQRGQLVFDRRHNIPWGQSWNNLREARSFGRWAATLPGVEIATTLEIPYADAGDKPVTVDSARSLGTDLARTIARWLQDDMPR